MPTYIPGMGTIGDGDTGGFGRIGSAFTSPFKRTSQYGTVDPSGTLGFQSDQAGRFAGAGEAGFGALGREAGQFRRELGTRPSVSAEQLRQGLQQQQAAQMSMAASARPGSAPMAARTAMLGASRAGSAMSGQAAVARMQEQQMRDQQMAQLLMQQRQQELQAALGGRGQAIQGQGMLEQARTSRYAADMGTPTASSELLGSLGGFVPG